ncbi:type IV secretion protein Rhs [Rahnella sp. PD12R]|nr:type IV secretion protein Rhs [Rahnella sp. PD12R]
MKRLNLGKSDQFFHCTAFCRVSKSSGYNKAWATSLGGMKEMSDFALNKFGLYGKGKLSEEDMLRDNLADLEVNSYGLSCPSQTSCSDRCEKYIDSSSIETKKKLRS